VRGFDEPECVDRLRQLERVERRAVEVPDQPTPPAYEVVVSTEVRIESGAFAGRAKGRDQTEVGEQPQRAVDRIEGDCRDPLANISKESPRIRVSATLREVTEDLHALMRDLDASTSTGLLEVRHLPRDFPAFSVQSWTPSSERIPI
jgi:hypothetical protein